MQSNTWDNLPNAKHIDWVLLNVQHNPGAWVRERDAAHSLHLVSKINEAARHAHAQIIRLQREADRARIRNALYALRRIVVAPSRGLWSAEDACVALLAYDHADDVFHMTSDALRLLVTAGDPGATLLYVAAIVRSKS